MKEKTTSNTIMITDHQIDKVQIQAFCSSVIFTEEKIPDYNKLIGLLESITMEQAFEGKFYSIEDVLSNIAISKE